MILDFLLRSCADTVFHGRSRPCLLHQIKRCSAPCVGRIAKADYDALVEEAKRFLSGRSHEIQAELAQRMQDIQAVGQAFYIAQDEKKRSNCATGSKPTWRCK